MIGEQLDRDGVEDRARRTDRMPGSAMPKQSRPSMRREPGLVGDHDDLAAARHDLLDVRRGLLEQIVGRRQHDHRHLVVDQRDRPVLHLAGGIALGVDVGDLLELQRAFERERIGRCRGRDRARRAPRRSPRAISWIVSSWFSTSAARDGTSVSAVDSAASRAAIDAAARPRDGDGEAGEHDELGREGLGRGDADLGAGQGRQHRRRPRAPSCFPAR